MVQIVAFAGSFPDTGEYRIAAMGVGDVVDQFHDNHCLAHAGAAEKADLAALHVRGQ